MVATKLALAPRCISHWHGWTYPESVKEFRRSWKDAAERPRLGDELADHPTVKLLIGVIVPQDFLDLPRVRQLSLVVRQLRGGDLASKVGRQVPVGRSVLFPVRPRCS